MARILLNLLGMAVVLLSAQLADARMAIACSPYVYPCQCGLCPHIVNCDTKMSPECFCGKAEPGIYPHPQEKNKMWMCSFDKRAQIRYGVEVQCPAMLVFDPIMKVCTLPTALTPVPGNMAKNLKAGQASSAGKQPSSSKATVTGTRDYMGGQAAAYRMP